MWCSESSMFGHSMFRVFEVRYLVFIPRLISSRKSDLQPYCTFLEFFFTLCWFFSAKRRKSMFCIDKKERRSFLHKVSCSEKQVLYYWCQIRPCFFGQIPTFLDYSVAFVYDLLWIKCKNYCLKIPEPINKITESSRNIKMPKNQGLMSHTRV